VFSSSVWVFFRPYDCWRWLFGFPFLPAFRSAAMLKGTWYSELWCTCRFFCVLPEDCELAWLGRLGCFLNSYVNCFVPPIRVGAAFLLKFCLDCVVFVFTSWREAKELL
jgi:hypothetical protein